LQKIDYITLRDEESKELLKSLGVTKDIEIVADPVMGYELDFNETINESEKFISISVREWNKASDDFLKKIATTCDMLIESGYGIVFVPMHGEHDYTTSKEVVDMMKNDAKIFNYESSIEEKIMCIKKSKLMIGMRLHALIFAATVNTPMIGLSYDPKIDSFLKLVNQPCIGSVDGNWTSNDLFNMAKSILDNYDKSKMNLLENATKLKSNAKKTAQTAINVFKK
jgi:polysaccharide pyruvyl transferase WcaK-like protein